MLTSSSENESPCIKVCRLDEAGSLCIGCGRTLEEIAGWMKFGEAERREIAMRLPVRLSALSAAVEGG